MRSHLIFQVDQAISSIPSASIKRSIKRDSGIYRCVGTRSYDRYGSSYGRGYGRTESVYMEVIFWFGIKTLFLSSTILQVDFYPEGRGYSGVFSGRDNYYPRDDYFYGGGYRYILSILSISITSLDLFFRGQFGKNKALRNLPVFRAAAVSTSEDKIVSKSDAAQNSEERKSKNWSSWSLGEKMWKRKN